MSHNNTNHSHTTHHPHTMPVSLYKKILMWLLFLTIVTVAVSRIDFGAWNTVVALGIASLKAMLVLLFFMHLKFEDPIVWMYAAIPVMLVLVLLAGVFVDNPLREDVHSLPQQQEVVVGHAAHH